MRLTWLADVLRAARLTVVEHDGWQQRGADLLHVEGLVCHHTASKPTASDAAVCRILISGRSDLPGPLSQLGLARDGTVHVIAAGKANHNGHGEWGNQSVGVEAFNDGVGEPWPQPQLDAYVAVCAAICRKAGWPAAKVKAHRETDPTRKVDPRGIDMNAFRGRVAKAIPITVPCKELIVVHNHVRTLVAPNGGYWHLQADGGIITAPNGVGSPEAPYYGSVPQVGGLPDGSTAIDLVPHGPGYAVVAHHKGDVVTAYHFAP